MKFLSLNCRALASTQEKPPSPPASLPSPPLLSKERPISPTQSCAPQPLINSSPNSDSISPIRFQLHSGDIPAQENPLFCLGANPILPTWEKGRARTSFLSFSQQKSFRDQANGKKKNLFGAPRAVQTPEGDPKRNSYLSTVGVWKVLGKNLP